MKPLLSQQMGPQNEEKQDPQTKYKQTNKNSLKKQRVLDVWFYILDSLEPQSVGSDANLWAVGLL